MSTLDDADDLLNALDETCQKLEQHVGNPHSSNIASCEWSVLVEQEQKGVIADGEVYSVAPSSHLVNERTSYCSMPPGNPVNVCDTTTSEDLLHEARRKRNAARVVQQAAEQQRRLGEMLSTSEEGSKMKAEAALQDEQVRILAHNTFRELHALIAPKLRMVAPQAQQLTKLAERLESMATHSPKSSQLLVGDHSHSASNSCWDDNNILSSSSNMTTDMQHTMETDDLQALSAEVPQHPTTIMFISIPDTFANLAGHAIHHSIFETGSCLWEIPDPIGPRYRCG